MVGLQGSDTGQVWVEVSRRKALHYLDQGVQSRSIELKRELSKSKAEREMRRI